MAIQRVSTAAVRIGRVADRHVSTSEVRIGRVADTWSIGGTSASEHHWHTNVWPASVPNVSTTDPWKDEKQTRIIPAGLRNWHAKLGLGVVLSVQTDADAGRTRERARGNRGPGWNRTEHVGRIEDRGLNDDGAKLAGCVAGSVASELHVTDPIRVELRRPERERDVVSADRRPAGRKNADEGVDRVVDKRDIVAGPAVQTPDRGLRQS
eukprot:2575219-Rhodomonas_salina.1